MTIIIYRNSKSGRTVTMATAPEVTRSPGEVIGIRRDHKDATPPSKLKVGLRQIFAGGSAGECTMIVGH